MLNRQLSGLDVCCVILFLFLDPFVYRSLQATLDVAPENVELLLVIVDHDRSRCAMVRPSEGGGLLMIGWLLALRSLGASAQLDSDYGCPSQERILPCRCSMRDMEIQIWQVSRSLP